MAQDGILISVADTGSGMERALLARVFEPFFTTKDLGKGTGLGLSMVYGFVQQSGGNVEIDSVVGEGTIVKIWLPAIAEQVDRPREEKTRPVTDIDGAGVKILVVEDDADVRNVATSTLEALGFTVQEAQSGDEALLFLEADQSTALILSDVNMPGSLTGIDLGNIIRKRWPRLAVILTTGYVEENQNLEGFELLLKPYRRADLVHKLCNALPELMKGAP